VFDLLRRKRREPKWTKKQIAGINAEMAEGVIHEIAEVLAANGCCHGHDVTHTPPMFYPEMINCAILNAIRAARASCAKVAADQGGTVIAASILATAEDKLFPRVNAEASTAPDKCQFCLGAKGGANGNENRIGGAVVCDYCTVLLRKVGDNGGFEKRLVP
jgi:hypothetical protein